MNIALFSDTYPPEINGVATSTHNLAKTLRDHGNNVLVVTTNPFQNEVTYEDGILRIPGIHLKKLYGYRMSGFYSAKAMKIVQEFRPEIVHCQTDAGIGIFGSIIAARFHLGTVYTFHTMLEDYAYYVTKGHFDRFARHAVRFFFRGKSERFTEFISPSEKTADYLRSIGIDTTVTIIPTGIELDRFFPKEEDATDIAALKKQYGIPEDSYVVLSLGRIAKEKSIDVVLRGYKRFLDGSPKRKTTLVVTGLGPALEELKDLAKELGIDDHVVFTGPCKPDETQRYYHLGDCFVSASITETQGLTFMEAMAANLVVIARFDDNLVGTVIDGETGYFFQEEESFPEVLQKVIDLDSAKRKKIIASSKKVIDVYSMERFYENIMEVYERVRKKNW